MLLDYRLKLGRSGIRRSIFVRNAKELVIFVARELEGNLILRDSIKKICPFLILL